MTDVRILERRFAIDILLSVYNEPDRSKTEVAGMVSESARWKALDALIDAGLLRTTDGHVKHMTKYVSVTNKGKKAAKHLLAIQEAIA